MYLLEKYSAESYYVKSVFFLVFFFLIEPALAHIRDQGLLLNLNTINLEKSNLFMFLLIKQEKKKEKKSIVWILDNPCNI